MLGLDFAFEEAKVLSCIVFSILYQIVFVQNNPEAKVFNDKRPVETNQCLLDTFNYLVSAVIILLAAADPLYSAFYEYGKVGKILFGTVYLFFVVALLFMSYGLWLLTKIAKFNDTKANTGIMSFHIVAYVLVILA